MLFRSTRCTAHLRAISNTHPQTQWPKPKPPARKAAFGAKPERKKSIISGFNTRVSFFPFGVVQFMRSTEQKSRARSYIPFRYILAAKARREWGNLEKRETREMTWRESKWGRFAAFYSGQEWDFIITKGKYIHVS